MFKVVVNYCDLIFDYLMKQMLKNHNIYIFLLIYHFAHFILDKKNLDKSLHANSNITYSLTQLSLIASKY